MRSIRPRHSSSYSSSSVARRGASEVGPDDLATTDPLLGDEARPLEDGDVLLHGREAHRVVAGDLGDALLAGDRAAHDVTPGGVGQGGEDASKSGSSALIQPYGCMSSLSRPCVRDVSVGT